MLSLPLGALVGAAFRTGGMGAEECWCPALVWPSCPRRLVASLMMHGRNNGKKLMAVGDPAF